MSKLAAMSKLRAMSRWMILMLAVIAGVWAAEPLSPSPTAAPGSVMSPYAAEFFNRKVQPILVEHCYECHGNGRHKGGLSVATLDDFLRGAHDGVVLIPGDVAKSKLIPSIRWETSDEDLHMPPETKLSDAQIADLTQWVAMGAPWALSSVAATSTPPAPVTKPPFIGRLHPVIVHFPIACLLIAVLAEALVVLRGPVWRPATALLLAIGTLAALAAVISGTWLAEDVTAAVQRHQILGWVTLVGAASTCGLWFLERRWPLRLALLVTAAAAGLTGHLGGDLVYGAGWIF
jgi:uncharacterized membrane protein/mono/diheme cytochrome c family protein